MSKKRVILIVGIILAALLIVGGSYAYWLWTSNVNKSVIFNTANLDDYIVYDDGDAKFIGNFQPTDSFCESSYNMISFYKKSELDEIGIFASIKMKVNSIGVNISLSNDIYWIVTNGDCNITCTDGLSDSSVLAFGTFNGIVSGEEITLLSNIEVTTVEQGYTVWVWIDSEGINLSNLSGETIDTNIWTDFEMLDNESSSETSETLLNGADPVLEFGMIPITLSSDGVATSADTSSEWYNYGNKEWANAVLVDSTVRSTYINNDGTINSGLVIPDVNILAYYVWIPRYKYAFPNGDGSPEAISIVFENKDTAKSMGTATGSSYYTHPAFTFGDKELNAIWVGKFETSTVTSSICYTSESEANCIDVEPRIIPNVRSLRYQNVSTQFITSLKFAGGTLTNGNILFNGSNVFGLTNQTDSHMMKNSEWGAVAYLSHSQYGINEEIYINNSSAYHTGRSVGAVGSKGMDVLTYGTYTWIGQTINSSGAIGSYASDKTLGTKASTTGNITGVFDLVGGSVEYVMGVLSDTSGNPQSGYDSSSNSGFNGMLYNGGSYTAGIDFPSNKYYDLYNGTASTNACNENICYGHSLSETEQWYSDYAGFVASGFPWFVRGGRYNDGVDAGAFFYYSDGGFSFEDYSWRSVILAGN